MDVKDKVVVVTGAASGIGRALAKRFHAAGARHIVCADLDEAGALRVANEVSGTAFKTDVGREDDVRTLIETVESQIGPIDLFCSNAGIGIGGGADAPNDAWQRIWDINVMAHVWAARHVIPRMVDRGGGYLLNTASAAGLLTQIGAAPYAVTKHAAVAFAEWLAITHGDAGVKVSVLCPQAVRTAMTAGAAESVANIDGMMEPDAVAEACMQAISVEQFLVLPHPEVLEYMQRKAGDYDRWLRGMRKLNRQYRY
jgi:NAD(P)-dependent dehydrogenase (short-subunit alcohol dehydrogenase family)